MYCARTHTIKLPLTLALSRFIPSHQNPKLNNFRLLIYDRSMSLILLHQVLAPTSSISSHQTSRFGSARQSFGSEVLRLGCGAWGWVGKQDSKDDIQFGERLFILEMAQTCQRYFIEYRAGAGNGDNVQLIKNNPPPPPPFFKA